MTTESRGLPDTNRTHGQPERRRVSKVEKGWPRPYAWYEADEHQVADGTRMSGNLPVPWVAEVGPHGVGWTTFHGDADRAHDERLCQVCGLQLGSIVLLGLARPGETSGPGCHPRCMALAVQHCPHLALDGVIAYQYTGPGPGYVDDIAFPWNSPYNGLYAENVNVSTYAVPLTAADVKALAKRDPMGGSAPNDTSEARYPR